jgi:hypothetical protein
MSHTVNAATELLTLALSSFNQTLCVDTLDEIDYNHQPLLSELKQAHLNLQDMEAVRHQFPPVYCLITDLMVLSQSINQRVAHFEKIDASN